RFMTLVKQSQELKHVSYHKLYDILKQHQHEVNEIRAKKIARVANPLALVAQQQQIYHPQTHPTQFNQKSSTRTHQAATKNRGKAVVNSPQPIYDQEPFMVDDDEDTSKDKEIDKLMALISLSFKKIYKPTNNNLRTSSNNSSSMVKKSGIQCYNCKEYRHVARECQKPKRVKDAAYHREKMLLYKQEEAGIQLNAEQAYWKDDTDDESDEQELEAHYMETVGTTVVQKSGIQCYNCKKFGHVARECQKPKRAKDAAYHKEKMLLCKQEEAGFQLNAEQADWKDDIDDEPKDQELEAHYMYMAKIQKVNPDASDNSGLIFDTEPLQKVSNDDNYNVFAIKSKHPEQSKSVNDTYPIEQDGHNVIIDSLDMSYDKEQLDQDDDDDLANERELLASLIVKLKCEIDDSKNRNKFLETSNKVLVDKL
nr:hypothetical protein [Tanacetum cinerariifolium]